MGLSSSLSFDAIPAAARCYFGLPGCFSSAKPLDNEENAIEGCWSANVIAWRPPALLGLVLCNRALAARRCKLAQVLIAHTHHAPYHCATTWRPA